MYVLNIQVRVVLCKVTMLKCPRTIYTNIEKLKILKIGIPHIIFNYLIGLFFSGLFF